MVRAEFAKIFRFLPVWGYLLLCLLANAIIAFNTDETEAFNAISSVTSRTGSKVDAAFWDRMKSVEESEEKAYVSYLAEGMEPVYEDYDLKGLSAFYENQVSASSFAVSLMKQKYEGLATQVQRLAENGADRELYAGDVTTRSHQNLFSTLMRTMNGEVCILVMLLTVYLLGYERLYRTEAAFFTTKKGRGLVLCKVLVSLVTGVLAYALLAGISFGIYFSHWDFSGMWESNVASPFNLVKDLQHMKPFLTVCDLTVKHYLAASVGLSLVLVLIAVLFAAALGLLVRNTYVAGLLTMLLPVVSHFVSILLAEGKCWGAYLLTQFWPVNIWLAEPVWFTEGGLNAPCLWFEVKGLSLSLLFFVLLGAAVLKRFQRRDI